MNPLHKATSIRIFLNEKTTAVPHAVIYFPRNGIKFGKNNFTKIEFDLTSFDTVSGVDLKETRPVTVKADSRKYHNSRAAALREVGEGKYLSGRWSIGEHRSITIDLALTADRCVGTVICEQKKKTPVSAVLKREGINGTEYRVEFNNSPAAAMATKMVIERTKTVSINKELTHADIIDMIKGDKELYHKVACVIRRDRSTTAPRENNFVKRSERFLEEFEQECEAVPANEESDFINAPKTVDETTFDNENNDDHKVLANQSEQEQEEPMNMMDALDEVYQEPQKPIRSREAMQAIGEWLDDYADAAEGAHARLREAIDNIDYAGMSRCEAFEAIGVENRRLAVSRIPKPTASIRRVNWYDEAA
ncbi:hypothetical protein M2R28_16315 [Aeromonas hydrophila]|uniref:hypothetical protein n=1 Tax=Aeromonas hydrophila TaxID=644 RepID=UPI00208E602B|nr:hypothetical protein [Aeromonas hydrophila]MCO4201231.1 hypothetical protein [Aeromonas hydrophila]